MRKLYTLLMLFLLLFFCGCAEKQNVAVKKETSADQLALLKKIEIVKVDNKYELNIYPSFKDVSVFYGKNPYTLTIIVPNTEVSSDAMVYSYSDKLIERITVLPKQNQAVITIKLSEDVDYSYSTTDEAVKISFKVDKAEVKSVLKSSNWLENAEILNVKSGTYISDPENLSDENNLLLNLTSDGAIRLDYGYLNGNTVYIDFYDIKFIPEKNTFPGKGIVKDIKIASSLFPQKVRVLITLTKKVDVNVGYKSGKYIVSSNKLNLENADNFIFKITSKSVGKVQSINLATTGKLPYEKKIIDGNLVLIFNGDVKFGSEVLPIMFFEGAPIKYVKIGKVGGKPSVVFVPNGDIFSKVEDEKGGITVYSSFEKFSKDTETGGEKSKSTVPTTDLVSLSIKDMDIREAIKLIYYGRNKNIIFGKEVQGKTTLFVKDVHYKTALAAIYRENNLVEVEEDNVIWVIGKSRQDEMMAEKTKLAKMAEEEQKTEPLITEIIPVNYYKASDFDAIVKGVLSPRGKSQVEDKSNSFVVTDTKTAIERIKGVLKNVDKQTPQVNIEARIVEVTDSNSLAYGITWSANTNIQHTTANFPHSIGINGNANNYMVNLPVANPTGALALKLGNLSGTFNLDLAISAMESQQKAKTISSPRITTLDNQEAEIKSGGKAYIVPSGDNTATQEIDVGIKLKVKPHITANNMIFMEIEVEKSTLGQVSGTNAETQEKRAKTQVLLASGETTVIGGIYEDEQNSIRNEVPFFSKIPILGWLFKSNNDIRTKRELLVFITPRVQNQ